MARGTEAQEPAGVVTRTVAVSLQLFTRNVAPSNGAPQPVPPCAPRAF